MSDWYSLSEKLNKEKENPVNYDVVGTVTISAREYRDLIQRVDEAIAVAKSEHQDYSKEYSLKREAEDKAEKLEKSIVIIRATANEYMQFISENGLADKYKLWKFEKSQKEGEEG